jgi:hypothetical protein
VCNPSGACNAVVRLTRAHATRARQRDALDLRDNMVDLPSAVATSVRENSRRESAGRVRVTEKADRATVEQALDPRTRLVRAHGTHGLVCM